MVTDGQSRGDPPQGCDDLDRLTANGREREVPSGTVLFREGEPGDFFYLVLEGELEIVKSLGLADEVVLAVRGAGDTVGEMSLLSSDETRTASVRSRTAVRLCEVTRADLDAAMLRQPALANDLARMLTGRLRESDYATIRHLREKNDELGRAYQALKAAQDQLIEKERLEHEMRLARLIQRTLLPEDLPEPAGWQLAADYRPAREVGGDFYDFVTLPKERLGLMIGDVTGKGIPAALVMATTLSALRAIAGEHDSPGSVLERVNELLVPVMLPHMFVTCLYAVLDIRTGRLRFANAGHDLPWWQSADAAAELRATGMPLGLMGGMRYEEKEADLGPGERVLFRSDGLVEAHNRQREMFGSGRLRELLSTHRHAMGEELIKVVLAALSTFTGKGAEQEDDITVVVLQRADGNGLGR